MIHESDERNLLQPLRTAAGTLLVMWAVLRLALWWKFGRVADVGAGALSWILPAGVLSDLVVLVYLLLPFTVFLLLVPVRRHVGTAGRALLRIGFGLTLFGLLYLCAVEYYFFEEFDARLNLVAFDYLMYPTEVIGDIRDTYPVNQVLLATAAVAALVTYLLRKRLVIPADTVVSRRKQLALLAGHVLLVVLFAVLISTRTFVTSPNRVAKELAVNGISSFFEAARTSEIDYHTYYPSEDSQQAFQTLVKELGKGGGEFTRLSEGRLTRRFAARPEGFGKLNIVVISSESFGAEFSGAYGAKTTFTPELDKLAPAALMFSNAYASGTRTVRGLEAITASFPPIPSVSILRRPNNENIATWGGVMRAQGYRTSFLYGGYGYFDNMNYYFSHNGFEVVDRTQMPKPAFENIWGVSDEDLFDHALQYFDTQHASGQPFLSVIMTTSNHKPFTFRPGIPGIPASGGGRRAGVRYADFAMGRFLEQAKSHDWFKDTIFVIVADHGARVYGKTEIPLKTYRIPLLLYSPAHIKPDVVDTLVGQIDIAPTVLGLLGLPYEAPFFGQDVLQASNEPRIALFSHNHDVAVFRDNRLAVLGLNKVVTTMTYNSDSDTYTPAADDPELTRIAIAYYQTAYEQFKQHKYE